MNFMNAQDEYLQLKNQWRNRILSSYYVVVGILFLAELVMFLCIYFLKGNFSNGPVMYGLLYIVLPTTLNLASVFIAKYIQDRSDSETVKNYAVIGSLLVICAVICTIHSFFLICSAAFATPIVVSVILDEINVTRVSGALSAILLVVTGFLASIFDDVWSPLERWYNVIAGLIFLAIVFYICQSICNYEKEKKGIIYQTSLTQERMHTALRMDAMTNLYNHSEFYHCMDESVRWCHNNDKPFSLAVIDVDLFKSVNDTYGHENGDVVLIKIASILRDNCPVTAKAFRYGGEEFAMIFEGTTEKEACELIEQIRQIIYEEKFSFMPGKHCSISSGIYQYDGQDMTKEEIFTKADEAMYQAKQTGRNRTICSSSR